MASYIVTYDLNNPGQNYDKILQIIKDQGGWARLSESSYAITSNLEPHSLYGRLEPHLDKNDTIYIIHLSQPCYGQGDKKVNEWLANNLDAGYQYA